MLKRRKEFMKSLVNEDSKGVLTQEGSDSIGG